MNRRNFFKKSGVCIAGTSLVSPSLLANEREDLLHIAAFDDKFPLIEITISELQQKMQRKELSSTQITKLYLERIKQIDQKMGLRSVIEINPDALVMAKALDEERKNGKVRSDLHGIPILIKDNIDTQDTMMTTAGALALSGNRASQDAFIIKQLRAAGVVILGKANLSEWANFRSSRSTSGWSSRGGQTRNPYILDRSPLGSSAGSGVSVAANLCAAAIGTETDGSIVAPSSVNGIVGLKPTVGLLSRGGVIPISHTQDTAGPMTRSVRDAALLLGAMVGIDAEDEITKTSAEKSRTDYTVYLDKNALKGKTLGVEKTFLNGHERVVALFKEAIETLKKLGANIVEVELLKQTRELRAAEFMVLQYEFKDGVNKYLQKAKASVKKLSEVIAYNQANADKAMPYFRQETLEACEAKGDLNTPEYVEALRKSTSSRQIIDTLLREYKLDAIVGITSGMANCIDLANGDYGTGFSFSSPAAMAGYPHITVPMGFAFHLPCGLSLMAGAYQEAELLGMAYAYEQASKHRRAPRYFSSLSEAK